MVTVRVAVGEEALADVLNLLPEGDAVLENTVLREKANGFAAIVELKARMQIAIGPGAILQRLVIRPDEQKTLRSNHGVCGNLPFGRLGKIVGEKEAAEVHLGVVRIV